MHVLAVAASAFDKADVALFCKGLDVIYRRFIEFNQLDQFKYPFINIEEGHMTTETAGQ
jgi:hypothetical protein